VKIKIDSLVGCHCVDVGMQTYDNQVCMIPPFELFNCLGEKKTEWKAMVDKKEKSHQIVCVDTCLATEIGWLWHQGIITTGCCCGHGEKGMAMINVADKSIKKMEELGYEHEAIDPKNPEAHKYTFIPKTI
jgi:hypothetical protein